MIFSGWSWMNSCYRYCLKDLTNSQYLFIFLILIKSVTHEDAWWEWKKSACINQKQWYEIKPIRIKVSFVHSLLSTFSSPPCLFVCRIEGTELLFSSWSKHRGGFCSWYRGLLCSRSCPASDGWEMCCASKELRRFSFRPPQLNPCSSLGSGPSKSPLGCSGHCNHNPWLGAQPGWAQVMVTPRTRCQSRGFGEQAGSAVPFCTVKFVEWKPSPWHSKAKLSSLPRVPCPSDKVMFIYGTSCEFVGVPQCL